MEPARAPVLDIDAPFVALQGLGYGLTQPLLRGTLSVRLPCDADVAALDRIFAQALEVAAPGRAGPGDEPVAVRLVASVLHWTSELQRQAGIPVHAPARVWNEPAAAARVRVHVAAAYPYPPPLYFQVALQGIVDLVRQLADEPAPAAPARVEPLTRRMGELRQSIRRYAPPGVNTARFLKAAHALDLPCLWLGGQVFAFGQGRHVRWLDAGLTDRTPALGTWLARQKVVGAQVLRQLGFPVAPHIVAASAEEAVRAAQALGYPVVVKPVDTDGGVGVAAGLDDATQVRDAWAQARRHSAGVLVERHVEGRDYRLIVADGRLVKAVWRRPGGVTGDGRHTVAALVDQAQRQPDQVRRSRERGQALLALDAEARDLLQRRGLSPGSVPAAGEFVALRRRANVSAGGEPVLVDAEVHADNRLLAERVARALGLDAAGVDLILPDIARSWLEGGAVVCEVNAKPQIGEGTTPQLYGEMLRAMLGGGDGRIPLACLLGGDEARAVADELRASLQQQGLRVGLAGGDGAVTAGGRIAGADAGWFAAARAVLGDREVDAALLVADAAELPRTGLPFDRCDLLVLAGAAWPVDQLAALVGPHVRGAVVASPAWASQREAWCAHTRAAWRPAAGGEDSGSLAATCLSWWRDDLARPAASITQEAP